LAYKCRTDRLVDALEGQDAVSEILIFPVGIKEGATNGEELAAWMFTKDMIKEVYGY
jgi:hypothetical protein